MALYPMHDLVVLLPGITGSVLADSSGPVWDLSGKAVWQFVKSRGDRLQQLAVPPHDPRQPPPATGISATGLINGFHGVFGLAKIDGYAPLHEAIRSRFKVTPGRWDDDVPANLLDFPYDWRLSSRVNAQLLEAGIGRKLAVWRRHTGNDDAKVILVAHSMGGLVSQYWIEVLGGWRDCRALISFGTPYRGSLDALGYLAHGYKKAFIELTDVLLSCPSVYELLPIYRAVQVDGEWHRPSEVDLPIVSPHLKDLARTYVAAAKDFHDEIHDAAERNAQDADRQRATVVVPFVGVHQQTQQSAVIEQGRLTMSPRLPAWIQDDVGGGDGTVPRVSALPLGTTDGFFATFLAAQHGSLQNVAQVLDDVVERLRQSQSKHMQEIRGALRPAARAIDMVVDDVFLPDEPVVVRARSVDHDGDRTGDALRVVLVPEGGAEAVGVPLLPGDEYDEVELPALPPGRYRVRVEPADTVTVAVPSVVDVFEVSGS